MKKIAIRIAALLCLCLAFSLTIAKADVKATEGEDVTSKVEQFGYIYSANNALVLNFAKFSKTGYYSYEVIRNDTEEVIGTGDISPNNHTVQEALGDSLDENIVYTVKVTDKDSGDYITATYQAGVKITSSKVTNENSKFHVVWKVDDDNANKYTSFDVAFHPFTGYPKTVASASAKGSARSVDVGTSGCKTGVKYRAIIVGKTGDNYGYGVQYKKKNKKGIYYIPTPNPTTGLSVVADTGKAILSWSAAKNATGYEISYKRGTGSYSNPIRRKATSVTFTGLKQGSKYTFRIRSYDYNSAWNEGSVYANSYTYKSVVIPKVAGKVKDAKFSLDDYGYLFLSWKKTARATSYEIYRKAEGEDAYKMILKTKKTKMKVKGLNDDTKYTFLIYACTGKYRSAERAVKKIKPAEYYKKHIRFLASRVKTIRYVGYSRCIYTKKKYSKAVREAYVNYKGYASRSKYLIFASLYTQQATIFKGSKGKWKAWKTFLIASGAADGRTPRGTFTLKYKERKWQHRGWHSSYVSHFYKKASFHARPTYNSGKIKEKTLGKPISNACIRCPTPIAKFIYSSIPVGTKVRIR